MNRRLAEDIRLVERSSSWLVRSASEVVLGTPIGLHADTIARSCGDESQWRYAGRLAGAAEAAELGGDGLTQIELAESRDGTLIAILTPDRWDPTEEELVHLGLRVVEVASLQEPALARNDADQLVVRAVVTASDLDPLGPGAGAFEPTAEIGIVLMRREVGPASLVASLHDTGLHP